MGGSAIEEVLGRCEVVGPAAKSVGIQVEDGRVEAREIDDCDLMSGSWVQILRRDCSCWTMRLFSWVGQDVRQAE